MVGEGLGVGVDEVGLGVGVARDLGVYVGRDLGVRVRVGAGDVVV